MNTTSEQNVLKKSVVTLGKIALPVFVILLGVVGTLAYFHWVDFRFAIFATFPFAIVIGLSIFQKRISAYSILFSLIGILWISSGFMMAYYKTLPLPAMSVAVQLGVGFSNLGLGLLLITGSVAMSDFNRANRTSKKLYPKFSMIFLFICGVFVFGFGIFSLVSGVQYLNMLR